jgi:LmbE family N-acetylglucosaminyl deacetylase
MVVFSNKVAEMNQTTSHKSKHKKRKTVAVIVAHPDDETLWAGGTMMCHASWQWFIVCLCREHDEDRAPRFHHALKYLNAEGIMGDLDDGPEQKPLPAAEVEQTILDLLPRKHYNLLITHNPTGEYTKHLRHEEISRAVISLWHKGDISADELWTFAYDDGNKQHFPVSVENATLYTLLTKKTWLRKYSIITKTYGFPKNGWEAQTTPRSESFWRFPNSKDADKWLTNGGILL